jgi:hypothetical protein
MFDVWARSHGVYLNSQRSSIFLRHYTLPTLPNLLVEEEHHRIYGGLYQSHGAAYHYVPCHNPGYGESRSHVQYRKTCCLFHDLPPLPQSTIGFDTASGYGLLKTRKMIVFIS